MPPLRNVVLPSYLKSSFPPRGGPRGSLTDTTLRLGEVVAAYAPNDPRNRGVTKNKQWLYVVNVNYRNGTGARSIVPYLCVVADLFGGLGDHLRYTVRRTDAESKGGAAFSKGSQVLILCPNGDKSLALIVGGVRHSKDQSSDPNDTFLDFEFNGVSASIGADGSLTLTVPGPTAVDGSPEDRDENNRGSTMTFAKDGTVTVTDQNGDSVTISPKERSISVRAGSHDSQVEHGWTLKAATVHVEADEVTVKSPKVNLGDEEASIDKLDEVVIGSGIDTFTGQPYYALDSTSKRVKAKR